MGDILGKGTSDKKSQKSDQKTRKDSSSIRKCEAPPDQTSTRSNHKTRKDLSQNIGSMFDKTLEILNSTPSRCILSMSLWDCRAARVSTSQKLTQLDGWLWIAKRKWQSWLKGITVCWCYVGWVLSYRGDWNNNCRWKEKYVVNTFWKVSSGTSSRAKITCTANTVTAKNYIYIPHQLFIAIHAAQQIQSETTLSGVSLLYVIL